MSSPDPAHKPSGELPVVEKIDPGQLQHFVTTIKSAEQQIGENIIQALSHAGTVAVMTTVVAGPDGRQHVVSAALNRDRLLQVQELLDCAERERVAEDPCLGFHCLLKPKGAPGEAET